MITQYLENRQREKRGKLIDPSCISQYSDNPRSNLSKNLRKVIAAGLLAASIYGGVSQYTAAVNENRKEYEFVTEQINTFLLDIEKNDYSSAEEKKQNILDYLNDLNANGRMGISSNDRESLIRRFKTKKSLENTITPPIIESNSQTNLPFNIPGISK